jgi:IMP and pyridine-specific 5'-nucleotidase
MDVKKSTRFFLDELALRARKEVKAIKARLPFCTFNGGSDVFVDVGTKQVGIDVLRDLVGAERSQALHVGDQFTRTGNDLLARRSCGTIWVDDPGETKSILASLLEKLNVKLDA